MLFFTKGISIDPTSFQAQSLKDLQAKREESDRKKEEELKFNEEVHSDPMAMLFMNRRFTGFRC